MYMLPVCSLDFGSRSQVITEGCRCMASMEDYSRL